MSFFIFVIDFNITDFFCIFKIVIFVNLFYLGLLCIFSSSLNVSNRSI